MKRIIGTFGSLLALTLVFSSCNNEKKESSEEKTSEIKQVMPMLKLENVNYNLDTLNMKGFVAFDQASDKKKTHCDDSTRMVGIE